MLINNVNVLDLRRGDEVVIIEGSGRHRGWSADYGLIEMASLPQQGAARLGRISKGKHARLRPNEPYVSLTVYGDDWSAQYSILVPFDTELTVIR